MAVVRVWHPIEDLPEGLRTYRPRELDVLVPVWEESRQDLAQSKALEEFHQRLARQWAIETGILERLYTVDRGTTQLLVEQGFDASLVAHGSTDLAPERLVEFLQAHRDALDGLFEFVKGDVPLTTSYIRELHVALTRAQEETEAVDALGRIVRVPLLKGEYKRLPNNPVRGDGTVYLYCPPEQVAGEMERLVRMHREHVRDGVEAAVRAAWLHHRFTQIHPFQDGNGRVARALATLEFLRARLFPLVIDRDQRTAYIDALEQADAGDLLPLIRLFAAAERRALMRALGLAQDAIQTAQNMTAAVAAFTRDLRRSLADPEASARQALEVAEELSRRLQRRLDDVRTLLERDLGGTGIGVAVGRSNHGNAIWYRAQILATAGALDYYANVAAPRLWVRLHLSGRMRADLVFSFHAVGAHPRGAMACVAFTNVPLERGPEGEPQWRSDPACTEPFAFSHGTDPEAVTPEFIAWVDRAVQVGLETVRRYL